MDVSMDLIQCSTSNLRMAGCLTFRGDGREVLFVANSGIASTNPRLSVLCLALSDDRADTGVS